MLGWRDYLRHLDYLLLASTIGLIAYGVTMIFFATRHDVAGDPYAFVRQQLIAAVLGFFLAAAVTLLDYDLYRRFQWFLYGFAVLSLVAVLPLGQVVNGARRWIDLGFTRFQPSSLAILLIALSIGAVLADRVELVGAKRVTALALGMVVVPAYLVYQQPDFGSAMVLVVLTLAMLFFYGTSWKHFAVLFGVGAAAFVAALKVLPMAGLQVFHSYQIDRLLVFLDVSRDPSGSGYNIIQSMIAVGSGALTGRGDMATQTTLDFLPEHHTDFIFAVLSERYGFVGALVLLILYAVFVWRCLRIATLSRDMYGSILAGGIGATVLFQLFVNIGMTIGIMPVTGIPLPFISYGGTAMMTFLMLVGLLQAIHVRGTTATNARGRLVQ